MLNAFARDAAAEDLGDNLDNFIADRSSEALDDGDDPRQPGERRERDPGLDELRVARLREQMRRDALQLSTGFDDAEQDLGGYPFGLGRRPDDDDAGADKEIDALTFSPEQVAEARQFLGLQVRGLRYDHFWQILLCSNCYQKVKDRLDRVLSYLRDQYSYCFWCGTRYGDKGDMDASCPGQDEEAHD